MWYCLNILEIGKDRWTQIQHRPNHAVTVLVDAAENVDKVAAKTIGVTEMPDRAAVTLTATTAMTVQIAAIATSSGKTAQTVTGANEMIARHAQTVTTEMIVATAKTIVVVVGEAVAALASRVAADATAKHPINR